MTDEEKMKLAREAAASVRPFSHNSALIKDGDRDGIDIVQSALAAINALAPRLEEAEKLLREAKRYVGDKYNEDAALADRITAFLKQGEAS